MDTVFNLLRIIAIAFLAFVGGAFVVLTKTFPYDYFNDAYQAIIAVHDQKTRYKSPLQTDLWRAARTAKRGVTLYDKAKAFIGFTLYSSSQAQKAFLIDMNGNAVQEWSLPIARIWEDPKRRPRPAGYVTWDFVYMYPNGDLLAMYAGMGETPWGYGLVKMDKNSKVVWKYFDYVHHQLDVADDGKIYTLTNAIRTNHIEGYENLTPPRIDDYVVVLSPDGKPLKRVSILDALLRSRYGRMMHATAWDIRSDFLHTNAIKIIDRATAAKLPFAKEGQVLLSLREIDTIAVLDLNKQEVVWAIRGPWHRQHDADLLSNGDIMLFDNYGHYGPGGLSRVVEFKPTPLDIDWIYAGNEKHPLESGIRSGQQRLPNGNTLITESDGGRLFEVTRNGQIVWEYIDPVRAGANNELIPVISQGTQRFDAASLDPKFLASLRQSKLHARTNTDRAGSAGTAIRTSK